MSVRHRTSSILTIDKFLVMSDHQFQEREFEVGSEGVGLLDFLMNGQAGPLVGRQ